MDNNPVFVTRPSLAPLDEYVELLKGVWERGILTHDGPLVQQLEDELCKKLDIPGFMAVSNGTIALQAAIKGLALKGEVITTPFTWIATISAIKCEGCVPVFCDIDRGTLNIDPCKIEPLINERTVAVMPVHVFGNPCDVGAIENIAKKHDLKVIYDGAHAMGSTFKGKSLLGYGDITATSLNATKLLNTAEGGGCIAKSPAIREKLKRIRYFGYNGYREIVEEGFNGKMSELHAALGIVNLKYFDRVLADRKIKYNLYRDALSLISGIEFQAVKHGDQNYSCMPVVFESEEQLLKVEQALHGQNIYPRRYFYPSLNTLTNILEYRHCPVSEEVCKKVLCLPLYREISEEVIYRVVDCIRNSFAAKRKLDRDRKSSVSL